MSDKNDSQNESPNKEDSLVDALESIQGLLAKSDSKLSAARESLATASSSQERFNSLNKSTGSHSEETDIPVLNDIVIPAKNTDSEDTTLAIPENAAEDIPTLYSTIESPSPEIILNYLDDLQQKLEQTLSDALMNSIVSIEEQLKTSLSSEIDLIREQIKKDFS